jgi:glycosyltransferase involved in cell wall biosynthesis
MHLIYNGAAPEDFAREISPFETPTIAHVGTLHDYQEAQIVCLLQAFDAARQAGRLPARTRVSFVGPVGGALLSKLHELVDRLRLSENVEFHGPVPHSAAIDWMRRSHVLLLFVGANPYVRLSKISEYVASGRSILAFAPAESETGQETLRYGGAVVENSVSQAATALAELIGRGGVGGRPSVFAEPHPLSRRTEASELARLLNEVCERKRVAP